MAVHDRSQVPLFGLGERRIMSTKSGGGEGWLLLSTNWSIGGLLARGCLLPPAFGEPTQVPFLDDGFRESLPVAKDRVPGEWSMAVRRSRRNCLPIAIRFLPWEEDGLDDSKREASVRSLALSQVLELVFPSEKERKRFAGLSFPDFDVSRLGIRMKSDVEIFPEGERGDRPQTEFARDVHPEQDVRAGALALADSAAALQAILLSGCPGTEEWTRAVSSAPAGPSEAGKPRGWVEAVRLGLARGDATDGSLEGALLASASEVLSREYRIEVGWPASEVLDRISARTKERLPRHIREREAKRLEEWTDHCRAILTGRQDPPPLLDAGSVPMRAVLLLLLRGDLEPLMAARVGPDAKSDLKVGRDVRALAACLGAVRTGLRAMPVNLKSPNLESPRQMLEFLGVSILRELGLRPEAAGVTHVEVNYRELGVLEGEWVFKHGSTELLRKRREVDPTLSRVAAIGRQFGYSMKREGETSLRLSLDVEEGREQPVFLALHWDGRGENRFLRIWSPALDLSARGKRSSRWPTAALNKRPKSFLLDLLERNSHRDMSCRFAISRELQSVMAVADQLLATLDDQEFGYHVRHVGQVAAGLAREQAK